MQKVISKERAGFVKVYNKIAKIYDKRYGKSCLDAHEILLKEIDNLNKPIISILDIGCGTGELLKTLKHSSKGKKLFGIDPSFGMLKIALHKRITNAEFILAYAEQLPLQKQSIDLVISTTSLSHWGNIEEALSEIRGVLKVGGNAIFIEHKKPNFLIKILLAVINRLAIYRSERELKLIFNRVGFNIIKLYSNKKYVITCLVAN